MFKNVIIVVVIGSFLGAIGIYMNKDKTLIRDQLKSAEKLPRIAVSDFILTKYLDGRAYINGSGKKGFLLSSDSVVCVSNCFFERFQKDAPNQAFEASRAEIFFDSKTGLEKSDEMEIEKASMSKNVKIFHSNTILLTEKADYIAKSDEVSSELETLVYGKGASFKSQNGFLAKLTSDEVEFFGTVSGSFEFKD